MQKEARETKKVLVTWGAGVYDLSEFAKSHPGGADKLHMAKGGPIEPWWQMYPFHKEKEIMGLLEGYKVGELVPEDRLDEKDLPDFAEMQTQEHLGRSDKLVTL